jgi:formylglycine-generating enzyme required for sulfatase activity
VAAVRPPAPATPPSPAQPAVGIWPAPPREAPRSFRDCPECPEMVVVPAGTTWLASGRNVAIAAPFAVGKFEVTFEEWDACVAQGGCSHRPDDRGWGRGRQPVMNVNWDDAQAYVAWLSRKTGKPYRLLSEAEWEYAAQAGTGREVAPSQGANQANCNGCGSRWDNRQTAPVGSFAANNFGLHDMLGNVWEWTADCWNATHAGAPSDGKPRRTGVCQSGVLRGGSWIFPPLFSRSAFRNGGSTVNRIDDYGFRVARTL